MVAGVYGVVLCSRCRKAMGADLRNETASCQCGNVLKLKEMKKFFESRDQRGVASAVARMNAELEGGTEEWEALAEESAKPGADDLYSRMVSEASTMADSQERMELVVKSLTEIQGTFTRNDLQKALRMLGVREADKRLELMLRESIIYEPEPGVFRAV
ncbi:MAG: DUF1922 domain-containing protein [Thermoplasmata archaeon]